MRLRLLLIACVFCVNTASAQKLKTLYPVKVGEIPNKVLPHEAMYVLPAFTEGIALFRNGDSSIRKFNYNFLLGEMHFIDAIGDTLAIANPELLKSVVIDTMVFYYDKSYFREIFRAGEYKIAVLQEMVQIADKTRGAYDAGLGAGSIKTYGSILNNSQMYQLQVKKDVLFRKEIFFFISHGFNPFVKANKKNFHDFFEEKDIAKYVKEHRINFNDEQDLKNLLQFCVH